jgi:hypothetical protein
MTILRIKHNNSLSGLIQPLEQRVWVDVFIGAHFLALFGMAAYYLID